MSATARCKMSSNVLERWLISITDMPTPGSATRSRWASSSTGGGSTAGPAEKLKTRVMVVMGSIVLHETSTFKAQAPPSCTRPKTERHAERRRMYCAWATKGTKGTKNTKGTEGTKQRRGS